MGDKLYTKSYLRRITGFDRRPKFECALDGQVDVGYHLYPAPLLEPMATTYAKLVVPLLVDQDIIAETFNAARLEEPVGFFRPDVLPGLSIDEAIERVEDDVLELVPGPSCLVGQRLPSEYEQVLSEQYERLTSFEINGGYAGAWAAPGLLVAGYFSRERNDLVVAVDADTRAVCQINAHLSQMRQAWNDAWRPSAN